MRIFSIIIAVLFLASGALVATPASAAEPLNWEVKVDAPTGVPGVAILAAGTDIYDYAFDSSGMIVYVATGTGLYKSTFGGTFASDITSRMPTGVLGTIDFVAMAPDDTDIVVVADATPTNGIGAVISSDGGETWSSMGVIQDASGTANPAAILGLEVSPLVTGNIRYISVYGQDSANAPALYYYNYGAGIGAWKNATYTPDFVSVPAAVSTIDNIVALAFSPGFAADYMAVALSEQLGTASDNGTLRLHILSFNSRNWDTSVANGYPVTLAVTTAAATAFSVNSADLALHPDYDGGDEALRIAFAGASITSPAGTEIGGVWRCRDSAPAVALLGGSPAAGVGINSVAFDGTNLAAGTGVN